MTEMRQHPFTPGPFPAKQWAVESRSPLVATLTNLPATPAQRTKWLRRSWRGPRAGSMSTGTD